MKKCTYCGREYRDEAIVCAIDEQPLTVVQPSITQSQPTAVDADVGAFAHSPPPPLPYSPRPSYRDSGFFKYAALACGGIIAVLLLVIVIILLTRDTGTTAAGDGGAARIAQQQARQEARMRSAMESAMSTDNQMSTRMRSSVSSGTAPATAIERYVSSLKSMDMSECPAAFREAYLHHANAWQGLGMQIAQEPQSFGEGMLQGFFNGLGGEMDGGAGRIQRARDGRMEAVRTTWGEVEAIAVRYGARLQSH